MHLILEDASLEQAERLRQIIKPKFADRLVPQDPDDEPAGRLLERIKAQRGMRGDRLPTSKPKIGNKSRQSRG